MKKKVEDPLDKLMKLTKLMKQEKVQVSPKGPARPTNKWRSQEPKFSPKIEKSSNLVEGGGMEVDPARKDEYDAWRKDKLEEQNNRRIQIQRKWAAAAAARKKKAEEESEADY